MVNVVITGSNRGIGLSLAKVFATRGDRVFAVCRKASDDLVKLAKEKPNITIIPDVDVGEPLKTPLRDLIGPDVPVDVMINNAGILIRQDPASFEKEEAFEENIAKQININALGPMRATRSILPSLHQGSKVVMITSRMGSIDDNTSGGYYGYRASKTALNMLSVSLSQYFAGRGIFVGILHPGYVQTDMTEGNGNMDSDSCAKLLMQRIDELNEKTTGKMIDYSGKIIPW